MVDMNKETMPPDDASLARSRMMDLDHELVRTFVDDRVSAAQSDREKAVALYYAVRDEIRYDPYEFSGTVEGMRASATLEKGRGWCVPKAVLLAACCRAAGIPARVGFADVRNHLSTERMRRQMKTDVFFWHGYTAIWLGGQWLKATPAFNIGLCEKFRLRPLEFDGTGDSLYHSFDLEGNRHMEYLHYRGEFDQVPLDEMLATFAEHYDFGGMGGADFDADVAAENPDS
jgi:transglutaminase-like putative cysteine protease